MDYYEELGISRRATEKEIRRSYKRLTLLFHPDQQQDPEMRVLAETQMKRVNEMVGILTEPERRVLYDQSLSAGALVVNPPRWTRYAEWVRNNRGWSGVSLASVILLTSAVFIAAKNPLPMAKRQEPSSRARSE